MADAFGLVELDPVVRRPEHAGGDAGDHPAAEPAAGRELARRGAAAGPGPRTRPARTTSSPAPYRDGDELRRVHWRSTARHGELMVRREEQRWRNRAVLLLDTRARAHSGTGAGSSFEFAVSADRRPSACTWPAAGLDGQLVTDAGPGYSARARSRTRCSTRWR